MIELTRRQREVSNLIALGRTNAEIAAELKLSVRTVETHREEIFDRMGVRNAVELTRKMLGVE